MDQQTIINTPIEAIFMATNDLLVKFVRTPENERFIFHTALGDGSKCVDRLRVALSRVRSKLEQRGKTHRRFKMLVESCVPDVVKERDVVVLLKTFGEDARVSDGVQKLFDELITGEQINDDA